jgi:RNA-dependent RNA polymerase
MLGAKVETGEDTSNTRIPGVGKSCLSFDWSDETIHMKSVMKINSALLPPALRPLDAELAFDDVASQGIIIDDKRVGDRHHVIVTISVRRPPKYFIPLEGPGFGREMYRMHRRRATAMDFAVSGVVRLP